MAEELLNHADMIARDWRLSAQWRGYLTRVKWNVAAISVPPWS